MYEFWCLFVRPNLCTKIATSIQRRRAVESWEMIVNFLQLHHGSLENGHGEMPGQAPCQRSQEETNCVHLGLPQVNLLEKHVKKNDSVHRGVMTMLNVTQRHATCRCNSAPSGLIA